MKRIPLLKKLDAVFGQIAVALLPQPAAAQPGTVGRMLVIRPGGIGDAVLLIPVLRCLRESYPELRIDILAEARNAAVFGLCDLVEETLQYDQGDLLRVLFRSYDVVIDTEQWHRMSAVVARLVRAPVKIGFATNQRKRLLTHPVGYSHQAYELDSFLNLVAPLTDQCSRETPVPFLRVPGNARHQTDLLLKGLDRRPFVTLFPGASIIERRWPVERFQSLAGQLNSAGYAVVVIGGAEDRQAGDCIVAGRDGVNLAGLTSLHGSAAAIDASLLLVSGDSGMLHVAVGLGRPTVSLFGSGIAAKWAPRTRIHAVLNKNLACSPCTRFGDTPPCPIQAQCMTDISVDEVLAAVLRSVGMKIVSDGVGRGPSHTEWSTRC